MRRGASGANPPGPDPLVSHLRARPSSRSSGSSGFCVTANVFPWIFSRFFFFLFLSSHPFSDATSTESKLHATFVRRVNTAKRLRRVGPFQTKWGQFCVPVQVDDKTAAT